MTWNNLPADNTTDWTHIDFLNQFVAAYNERADIILGVPGAVNNYLVVDGGTRSIAEINYLFVEGDLAAAANPSNQPSILELQSRLEDLAHYFGAVDLFPVGAQVDISTSTPREGLYDLVEWRADAGLPVGGFTRKYPREIGDVADGGTNGERARHTGDTRMYEHTGGVWVLSSDQVSAVDTVTAYGFFDVGDYIGPWLFNELQAGIQALHTVRFPVKNTSTYTYDTPSHWWGEASARGAYQPELSPGVYDLVGMAAAAYSVGVWDENSGSGSSATASFLRFTKYLPDIIENGVRYGGTTMSGNFSDLGLGFFGFRDNGLTRTITKLYVYPKTDGIANTVFYDFGIGIDEEWTEIPGGYDAEMPGSGEGWEASLQWPWAIDQTMLPANPVATLGWFDTAYSSVTYQFRYDQIAGYVQYSGFVYP